MFMLARLSDASASCTRGVANIANVDQNPSRRSIITNCRGSTADRGQMT
jgi:hypothetical protein